jgi:probable HAF family extracellular repeat protein
MMRARLRGLWRATFIFGFLGALTAASRADALYSVTNLGPANPSADYLSGNSQLDPSGNYLPALSPADQAAFRAGSFDVYAHPATITNLPDFHQGDVVRQDIMDGDDILMRPWMVTSNSQGKEAGTADESIPAGTGSSSEDLVIFTPHPHTVYDPTNPQVPVQSPGWMTGLHNNAPFNGGPLGSFIGTVAGLNDQGYIATTQYNFSTKSQVPFLQGPGDYGGPLFNLGSLGGRNGVANALNNSNQVVGWSQIASGAQHAFLYANGAMQDLNVLIPPASGITLASAIGIDASGRIVAYGTDSSGQTQEFLLTPLAPPVPEPSTLAVLALGILAFAARQARSRRPAKS